MNAPQPLVLAIQWAGSPSDVLFADVVRAASSSMTLAAASGSNVTFATVFPDGSFSVRVASAVLALESPAPSGGQVFEP